jgi:hypothetical protein
VAHSGRYDAGSVPLDAKARPRLVERVAEAFDSSYVYPESARRWPLLCASMRSTATIAPSITGIDLARKLTEDLQEISHDQTCRCTFQFLCESA